MTQAQPTDNSNGIFLDFNNYQKIHCGLRWDPVDGAVIGADLDLVYATFDEAGNLIRVVSGKDQVKIDEGGSLYHSGDDEADGADGGDDERITLNLFSMPRRIHHIFLLVEIRSNHFFETVLNPEIHLFHGVEEKDFLHMQLGSLAGGDCRACIFVRLNRASGGWFLNHIGRYAVDIPDWHVALRSLLPEIKRTATGDAPVVPTQGETVPLYYKKQSRHRIVCGLSWDSKATRATKEDKRAEKEGYNATSFDLDLTCLMFGADGAYLDYISGSRAIDESGAVYHSGDDTTGAGEGDDEQISVELLKLSPEIQHIVFIAEVKSLHTLEQIGNPTIRIADGISDRSQLMARLDEGKQLNACIFARLVKKNDDWMLHYIGEYIDTADIQDWIEPVSAYLD
jgi:tellurium resistance protein TerZ